VVSSSGFEEITSFGAGALSGSWIFFFFMILMLYFF